jgi:hypothetical protein
MPTLWWIRKGFKKDPDPPFNSFSIRIQRAKPVRIHADPDPSKTFNLKSQKDEFLL